MMLTRRQFVASALAVVAGGLISVLPARAHHRPWHAGGPRPTPTPTPTPTQGNGYPAFYSGTY
jgi:hypothetical protein